jgi:hypothetical protein
MLMCDEFALLDNCNFCCCAEFCCRFGRRRCHASSGSKIHRLEIMPFKMRLWDEVRVSLG